MADGIPHDEAPVEVPPVFPSIPEDDEPVVAEEAEGIEADLEVEFEPEVVAEPLPLRVRPFDSKRYHPQTHILPAGGIRRFTNFARSVPEDLLLREPSFHLSSTAVEGESLAFQGYGAMTARDWYDELPAGVRDIIDETGFGLFCSGLTRVITSRPLLGALVERWWDTTNSFHFSTAGEMTMTPYDFTMITSLDIGGDPIPFDTDMGEWEAAWFELLGAHPPIYQTGMVRYTWFAKQFKGSEPETMEEMEQYARGFLMFVFDTTLFSNKWNTVGLYLLSALVTLPRVRFYNWGGAGLATLYGYMSSTSRLSEDFIGGYWRAWKLWVYAYFPTLAPEPIEELPLAVP